KKAADVAQAMHYSTADDMYAAIGFGDLAPVGVRNRFTADIRQKEEDDRQAAAQRALLEEHKTLEKPDERAKQKRAKASSEGVVVEGVDNLLVRLSHCCDPVPGDEIIGYITKGRGVSVHRKDCPNIKAAEKSGQRIVSVYWANPHGDKTNYDADIEVQGYNRNGMLNDVLRSINNSTRFLNSVNGKVDHNKMVTISLTIGVRNLEQLQLIMNGLKNIRDVYVVKRVIR
ncbi:MAG TPA: GTP pyrophosphokinase, partial [Candidatus Limosilactobacillus gallistercoris]|nr:GTP pyrophosphokinase [Candidatus Limosilactobacillus gallistercoris]